MNRRDFLKSNVLGAAGVALAASPLAAMTSCSPKKEDVELKLSFQEKTAPGDSLNERFDYMENLRIVGFQPGGRNLAARVNEFQQALRGRNIKVSAICAGFEGFILAETLQSRLSSIPQCVTS